MMHPEDAARTAGLTVVRDLGPVPDGLRGAVAAIGNFDGVHRGHQRLIAAARELAGPEGLPAIVTFDPHPRTYFRPDEPDFLLTPGDAKWRLLARYGVEAAFVLRFDSGLAATSARDFVAGRLCADLGLAGVVVGAEFRFGRGREGDAAGLAALAAELGLRCRIVPPEMAGEAPVSSSRVRAALEAGDIGLANALLGHPWFVEGEVIHGAKIGRTLGFPTANLALPESCRLRHGIYAVRLAVLGDGPGGEEAIYGGVASFGRRPTFDDGRPLLEPYLFDFAGDLYGRTLRVEFVAWIRGEERFASAEALVERMREDEAEARAALAMGGAAKSLPHVDVG